MKHKRKPSAADLTAIAPHLPSKAAEDKQRAELEQLFSTAARAGAGGTRVGVPGLRPLGKRGMDFVDAMTPKRQHKTHAYDQELPVDGPQNGTRRAVDGRVAISLPRTFCPDCGRTDRPRNGGAINMNVYPQGRPEWRLGPKDIMLSFFCDECYIQQLRSRNDKSNDLYLAQVGGVAQKGNYDAANRLVRIKSNTEAYMRAQMAVGNDEIFVKN